MSNLNIPDVQIDLPMDKIAAFCEHWQITEFALFGSVLRDDFHPESDVDVLVRFGTGSPITLLNWGDAEDELGEIFERPVDLVSRTAIEQSDNYIRRKNILKSTRTIYVRQS